MIRGAWLLGLAAVGAQICYPLTTGTLRDVVTVAVVLQLGAASVLHAAAVRGPAWALRLMVVTAVGGFAVELLGTRTGFPFGDYVYTGGRLGPELAGVPLLIGVAWTAGAYPAWCAAQRVAGARWVRRWLLAAAGLAGWDLFLDPQLVADGHWEWTGTFDGLPGVAEVPVGNYLGWAGVALVMAALLGAGRAAGTGAADGLPVALYCWTWLGSALAHGVFLGLPASAGYGLLGMGLLGLPLLLTLRAGPPPTAGRRAVSHARSAARTRLAR